jgi:hypothetical protein
LRPSSMSIHQLPSSERPAVPTSAQPSRIINFEAGFELGEGSHEALEAEA